MNVKKILVPIDFSSNTEKVLATAQGLNEKLGAPMHLLYVAESLAHYSGFVVPHISIDVLARDLRQYAENKMQSFLEEQQGGGCPECVGSVIQGDDVAEKIIDYARQHEVDLIIMGSHGYKGLERTLMGSVAEKVLRLSSCPVMVVRPNQ